jgi:phage baseplate assembly protein W
MRSYNIRFPIRDDNDKNTYFKLNQITKDAFSSNLLLLLLTEKGERYYDPNYGSNLLKYVFEPNDDITSKDVEQDIKRTVSQYIPNLNVKTVTFNRLVDDNGNEISENQLSVHIEFTFSEDTFTERGFIDINF